jgi:hypothetical protein
MYPFHKLMLEERVNPKDPALRPVTVGSVLTRFGCRVLVRMNMMDKVAQLLLSHQFSFGINGGGAASDFGLYHSPPGAPLICAD